MLEMFKQNPRFIVGAIVVHLFFLALFGVGLHFKSKERTATAVPKTIEVTIIDEKLVKKELDKLNARDKREARRKRDLIKKRKAEEKKLKDLRKKHKAAEKKETLRIASLEKKEKMLKDKQKKLKEKQLKEEKQLKDLTDKRIKEEARQEQARKDKELEEKLLAEEAIFKKAQAKAALRKAELKRRQTLIDKYMNLIEAKVNRYWIKPPKVSKGLVSVLHVKLIPTGDVIDVRISKSSGNTVYDKSVRAAVKRASPLPLPPADSGLFDTFRNLRLPMRMRSDQQT